MVNVLREILMWDSDTASGSGRDCQVSMTGYEPNAVGDGRYIGSCTCLGSSGYCLGFCLGYLFCIESMFRVYSFKILPFSTCYPV